MPRSDRTMQCGVVYFISLRPKGMYLLNIRYPRELTVENKEQPNPAAISLFTRAASNTVV